MEEKKKNEDIIREEQLRIREDDELEKKYSVPWKPFLIVVGVIISLMVACVIVILCNGGFYQW